MSYEREKQVAIQAVRAAAKTCEYVRLEKGPGFLEKRDGTPVTLADFASQAVICHALEEAFPTDSVVAEEDASALHELINAPLLEKVTRFVRLTFREATEMDVVSWIDRGRGETAGRFWTLDPIDGTKGFIRGDHYAVALSLIEGGRVKLGVLGCPSMSLTRGDGSWPRGVLFSAFLGEGAMMSPLHGEHFQSIHVNGPKSHEDMRFAESFESSHSDQKRQLEVARALGITYPALRMDGQAKYGAVARGEVDLYLRLPSPRGPDYKERIWDHAAGVIVVEEAGGKVTDMHGEPLNFSQGSIMYHNVGIIVSNGHIHEKVLEIVKRS